MQAAQGTHAGHFFHKLLEGLHRFGVNAVLIRGNLLQGAIKFFIGQVVEIRLGPAQHPEHVRANAIGKLTAQANIHTTAGHVGGNGHSAKPAGTGNDF